jgi:hypothetical protein
MPDSAQHSSSEGFIFFKHSLLASRAYPPQPRPASLTERLQSSIIGKKSGSASKVGQRPLRGVRQEKGLLTQALKTSAQPGSVGGGQRPEAVGSKNDRSQSRAPERVKLVHCTFWIDPRVRAEMERQAEEEGLYLSEVGAKACAAWVRNSIQQQQDDLLEPRLRHMMREEIQALGERLVFFELRNAFASEQTRILTTDLYKRQLQKEGVTKEKFYQLMDASDVMATKNITQRSPKFKGLLVQWEADFAKQGKEAAVN